MAGKDSQNLAVAHDVPDVILHRPQQLELVLPSLHRRRVAPQRVVGPSECARDGDDHL